MTYSRWSQVYWNFYSIFANVDVDDITDLQAVMIRERIREKFPNNYDLIS